MVWFFGYYNNSVCLELIIQAYFNCSAWSANLCREYGMSQATFYKWRSKYGDVDVNIVKRLKELEV
jgi:putative transposase